MTKIFYDSEFTGLTQGTTLISMGFVTEESETFYAVFTDYDKSQVNDWVNDNVLSNSILLDEDTISGADCFVVGDKGAVKTELEKWLSRFHHVQIIADVPHYDWVLFCQLWGGAFNIPANVSNAPRDLNQEIADYLRISEQEAFDINREEFCGVCFGDMKHNALWDAQVAKACWTKMRSAKEGKPASEITTNAIGQTLAAIRKGRGIRQIDLAHAMQVAENTIGMWERGESNMLAVALFQADYLLNGELLRRLQGK